MHSFVDGAGDRVYLEGPEYLGRVHRVDERHWRAERVKPDPEGRHCISTQTFGAARRYVIA
jgi:hypothetical protein